MTELKKAAQQALEALERMKRYGDVFLCRSHEQKPYDQVCEAITALRRALEQPAQQEPVAWRELCRRLYVELFHCDQQMMATLDEDGEPMWQQGATVRDALADAKAALEGSRPQAREPLTDEQIDELSRTMVKGNKSVNWLARAIEAKLREKNA